MLRLIDGGPHKRHRVSELDHRGRGIATILVFDVAFSFFKAPVANDNTVRNADQLQIGKHGTRAFIAVIE
jgi:hypothetical protein